MTRRQIKQRAEAVAWYIIKNSATVRETAREFEISKSTVHKDVTIRLSDIDGYLYERVRGVLDKNKAERALRGGMATARKWKQIQAS